MDAFARSLIVAHDILEKSPYKKMRAERYASFQSGEGARFEAGQMSLSELASLAVAGGEPAQRSGKQEYFESLINQYIWFFAKTIDPVAFSHRVFFTLNVWSQLSVFAYLNV